VIEEKTGGRNFGRKRHCLRGGRLNRASIDGSVLYHSLSRLVKALRVQLCLSCFEVEFSALGLFSRIWLKALRCLARSKNLCNAFNALILLLAGMQCGDVS
jgi:hypothetical protein